MGRHQIPASEVLINPLRRAVLHHLARVGGHASAMEVRGALGIPHRASLTWSANILVRAGMVRRRKIGAGCRRTVIYTLTLSGRAAISTERHNPSFLALESTA
ncbi:MarR family winged helix-turn-helix transcriptional regulator [Bradyrhizobium sp. 14AA]